MNKQSTRLKLIKEEVVNTVTLTELLPMATAAQTAVMKFTDTCMQFNDPNLRRISVSLNKDMSDLANAVRGMMSDSIGDQDPVHKQSLDNPNSNQSEHGPSRLESDNLGIEATPKMDALAENKKLKKALKQLLEALGEEVESTEEPADNFSVDTSEASTALNASSEQAANTVAEGPKSIDLSSAFNSVIDGLSDEQFVSFKEQVVNAMKASGVTEPDFQTKVQELENTQSVDDFNFALDALYDYADAQGVEIKTNTEVSEEAQEPVDSQTQEIV